MEVAGGGGRWIFEPFVAVVGSAVVAVTPAFVFTSAVLEAAGGDPRPL